MLAMLYVLAMSAAGIAAGMALFMRREAPPMPLYSVDRTDGENIKPGEFVNALVLAKGTATARKRVVGLRGVKADGSNVVAQVVKTTNVPGAGIMLSAYYDEREPLAQDDAETGTASLYASNDDEYAGDVSRPGSFNF